MEAAGRLDVTLHCKPNGNFEELQCDSGICWCADEFDGHILKGTFAVPESLWSYLPCCKVKRLCTSFGLTFVISDNSTLHGDQYLRKCESAAFAQKIMQKKLINRGSISALPNQILCNYDGSYGDVIVENAL
jgi:Thyroglobulin type-1 repeat